HDHQEPSRGGRQDPGAPALPGARDVRGAPPPRALRRHRLSRRPAGRGHPAGGARGDGGRRVRRDHLEPALPDGAAAGGGPRGDRARLRQSLRPRGGGGVPADSAGPAGGDHPPLRASDERRRGGRPGSGPSTLNAAAKKKILVVDDAGPVVVLCVNVLQALGYAVKGANRGETAVELLRKAPFDLMVLDYKMPGMTGFDVYQQAKALYPDIAVVLVTGHGSPEVVTEANRMGFDS